jgi:lysozyme family protein
MPDVRQIAQDIVTREGGYVNDPADPGGPTKHGVTLGTLRALARDVNADGVVDIADLRALNTAQAVEIFLTRYFDRPGLCLLPAALQASVFDMYVNAGSMAIKLLQRVLTAQGHKLRCDGVLGPATLAAVHACGAPALVDLYGVARRDFYYQLADARPASRKYALRRDGGKGGWILRAEEFISPALRLTQTQHQARVAAWT